LPKNNDGEKWDSSDGVGYSSGSDCLSSQPAHVMVSHFVRPHESILAGEDCFEQIGKPKLLKTPDVGLRAGTQIRV